MSNEKERKKTSNLPGFAIFCLILVGGFAAFMGVALATMGEWDSLSTPSYLIIAALVFGYIVHVCR